MDRFVAMHVFVRVVETGTFSAVARERNTNQSAISKQVAALEQHLGAKLLTRSTRALALTDDGQRYFEQARRLVGEVAEAEDQLRRGEGQLHGWLRVAAPAGFGLRELMPHVHRFLATHPDLKIDLKLDDRHIDLVDQGIDIAVRIGNLSDSALIARCIGNSHGALMASQGYLKTISGQKSMPLNPTDLLQHPCIVYTELSTKNVWRFSHADGSDVAVAVAGPLQSNNSEAVRAALLDGIGIACAPTWMAKEALASGQVQRLMPEWQITPLPIHLVCPPHRKHAIKVRAFSDYLARAFAHD